MWATQTGSEGCSPEYRVQPGDPCVPLVAGEQTCAHDVDAVNIQVVGTDVYDLDGDDDGIACDVAVPVGAATTTAPTPPAAEPFDVVPTALHVGLVVVCLWLLAVAGAGTAVWLDTHRKAASAEERRTNLGTAAMLLVGTSASALIAIVLGLAGWA